MFGASRGEQWRTDSTAGTATVQKWRWLLLPSMPHFFHPPIPCSAPALHSLSPSWLQCSPPSPSRAPIVLHGEDPKLTSTNSKLLTARPERVSLAPSQALHTSRTMRTTCDDTKSQETQSRCKRLQVQRCAFRRGTNLVKPALAQSSAASADSSVPVWCLYMHTDVQGWFVAEQGLTSSLSEGKLQATLQTRWCSDTHTHKKSCRHAPINHISQPTARKPSQCAQKPSEHTHACEHSCLSPPTNCKFIIQLPGFSKRIFHKQGWSFASD